jgi:chromosome segregation ATPase
MTTPAENTRSQTKRRARGDAAPIPENVPEQVRRARDARQEVECELLRVTRELDTAQNTIRITNNDIDTLRTNLNDAQRELQESTVELRNLQTRIQELNGQLQQDGADRATLQTNLAAAEQQLHDNETRLAETNVECTALREQLQQAETRAQTDSAQAEQRAAQLHRLPPDFVQLTEIAKGDAVNAETLDKLIASLRRHQLTDPANARLDTEDYKSFLLQMTGFHPRVFTEPPTNFPPAPRNTFPDAGLGT